LFLVPKPSTRTAPPSLAMASRDLRRLLDGAALVAREAARRSSGPDILRSALLAATDLAGLTRGTPRRPQPVPLPPESHPEGADSSRPSSSSVVYFSHDDASPLEPSLEQQPPPQESLHPAHARDITGTHSTAAAAAVAEPEAVAVARPKDEAVRPEVSPSSTPTPTPSPSSSSLPPPAPALVEKRRRPRERNVPSTPFTRALGSGCRAGMGRSTGISPAGDVWYTCWGRQSVSTLAVLVRPER
uniref:Uncharacterized protein n=1 Tax=Aegilops tauschii subsp. strangulata TaxID=200361 RepID=A0A453N9P0_AEGTS